MKTVLNVEPEADADRACQTLTIAIADLLRVAQEVPRGPRLFALWVSARTLERAMAHLTDALAARVDIDDDSTMHDGFCYRCGAPSRETDEGGYYACPSHL